VNPVSQNWQLCRLSSPPEHADAATNWLLEHGCEGVQIEDTAIVFDQSEDATLVPREEVTLTGYRVENPLETPEDLVRALSELPFEADLQIEAVQSHDWANEWRENFPPLEIGRFLIVPSWESVDESDLIQIQLDPGLAFGTGQHPTTRMCLELLGEVLSDGNEIRVLDVGCGSGILSVAAAKLGARVVASDLDPWCVAATKETLLPTASTNASKSMAARI
jgi:ribosomal protein L11 methyltransferase